VDNATRQNVRRLVENPRGMSEKEKELAAVVVRGGGKGQQLMRLVGKAAPTGIVSGGVGSSMGAAAGSFFGGPVGAAIGSVAVPAVGQAAKKLADRATMRNVEKLSQVIRSGGQTGSDLAKLARGGQMDIPSVQRIEKFAKRIGMTLSEMAAVLRQQATAE